VLIALNNELRRFEEGRLKQGELTIEEFPYVDLPISHWNHDEYLKLGREYWSAMFREAKKHRLSIFERSKQQQEVLTQLMECSSQLAAVIRNYVTLEDILTMRRD